MKGEGKEEGEGEKERKKEGRSRRRKHEKEEEEESMIKKKTIIFLENRYKLFCPSLFLLILIFLSWLLILVPLKPIDI